ncbi:threonine aldolase family protein [Sediminispirochaeta bajacaliforniensis]|uniref:threonine aldolase family protein n=1 Tax=Sediminispirochaeta bajacaliforniensis TaxID=148 RepID=UPI000360AD11|nr:threonine aldolase family protein [Sediminispirochaeta bajacaliforniensis]
MKQKFYDLRSDTITLPTRDMRKAMYRADVGDDVYGEDPTVIKLQELAAKITGKKDALFIPSGSMGNLIPLMINGGRGNEILAQKNSHILHYELSSAAALAGVTIVPVEGERGIIDPTELAKHLRPDIYYMPRVSMISVENTHNKEGGSCWSLEELKAVSDFAKKQNLLLHMDGARLFNACIAKGIAAKRYCGLVDTVTFCLSKGLGAPVGAVLCGSAKFIEEARRIRKMLGAGMRQAGFMAAAGIYALEHHIERLADDHRHASQIAQALAEKSWATINPADVETNILYFDTSNHDAVQVAAILKKRGIVCGPSGERTIRMVTHLGIDDQDAEEICKAISNCSI